jgi:hypothetical protein
MDAAQGVAAVGERERRLIFVSLTTRLTKDSRIHEAAEVRPLLTSNCEL